MIWRFICLFVLHISLTINSSFAQEIKWGNTLEFNSSSEKINFIGKSNEFIFMFSKEEKGLFSSSKKFIYFFEDSLLNLFEKLEITHELIPGKTTNYLGAATIDNNLYIFLTEVKDGKTTIYKLKIKPKQQVNYELFTTLDFEVSENNENYFSYFTQNKQLIIAGKRNYLEGKSSLLFILNCEFSSPPYSIIYKEVQYEGTDIKIYKSSVDSNYTMVFLKEYYQKTFSLNNGNEKSIVLLIDKKTSEISTKQVLTEANKSSNIFLLNPPDYILLNRELGHPKITLNQILINNQSKEIYDANINNVSSEKDDYANESFSENLITEKDFKNLNIINCYKDQDSTIVVICEQNWVEQICNTLNYRFGGVQCFDYYFSNTLFVFYFSKNGKLIKLNKLSKPQVTIDDLGTYNSIVLLKNKSDLCILFNDEASNAYKKNGKIKTMDNPYTSILSSVRINKLGLVDLKRMSNPKSKDPIVRPQKTFYISESKALLIATRGSNFRIGKIEF